MLSGGVLPLDLLDARTGAWIRTLKATDGTAENAIKEDR
jgi:hypothetical protein